MNGSVVRPIVKVSLKAGFEETFLLLLSTLNTPVARMYWSTLACQQSPRCTPLSIHPYRRQRERSSLCLYGCALGLTHITAKTSTDVLPCEQSQLSAGIITQESKWTDGCWSTGSDASLGDMFTGFPHWDKPATECSRLRDLAASQLTFGLQRVRDKPRSIVGASLYAVGRLLRRTAKGFRANKEYRKMFPRHGG